MYKLTFQLLLALLLGVLGNRTYAQAGTIETWADNHKPAADALRGWVATHPDAAHDLFEWDGNHPDRSKQFVNWAIANPSDNLAQFENSHSAWTEFGSIVNTHRPATKAFAEWCKAYPQAARTLMMHPNGLKWAGDHLFRTEMKMK